MRYAGAELSAAGVCCESFRRSSLDYSGFLFADMAFSESFRRGSFQLFRLSLMGLAVWLVYLMAEAPLPLAPISDMVGEQGVVLGLGMFRLGCMEH